MENEEVIDTVDTTEVSANADSLLNNTPVEVKEETAVETTEVVSEETATGLSMEDLKAYIPEDLKENKLWDKYKTVEEFLKGSAEINSWAGKRGDIPQADASPDEWNQFYNKIGRPETASEYGIKAIDGLESAQPRLEQAMELAHQVGMSKTQADTFFKGMMEMELADSNSFKESQTKSRSAEMQKLSEVWGEGQEDMIDSVTRFEKSLGVFEAFEESGLNTNADLLIMMGTLANKLAEDPAIDTGMSRTSAGLDAQIKDVDTQLRELSVQGKRAPDELLMKRKDLYSKRYN